MPRLVGKGTLYGDIYSWSRINSKGYQNLVTIPEEDQEDQFEEPSPTRSGPTQVFWDLDLATPRTGLTQIFGEIEVRHYNTQDLTKELVELPGKLGEGRQRGARELRSSCSPPQEEKGSWIGWKRIKTPATQARI